MSTQNQSLIDAQNPSTKGVQSLAGAQNPPTKGGRCPKCRTITENLNSEEYVSESGRPMVRSQCSICGCKKTQFGKRTKIEKSQEPIDIRKSHGETVQEEIPIEPSHPIKQRGRPRKNSIVVDK